MARSSGRVYARRQYGVNGLGLSLRGMSWLVCTVIQHSCQGRAPGQLDPFSFRLPLLRPSRSTPGRLPTQVFMMVTILPYIYISHRLLLHERHDRVLHTQ